MKNKIIERDKLLLQQNSIVVENFHKKFKDIDIGPLSFTIEKGKVTALLGSSGSGKSVFLNSLLGATLSYNGSIFINGKERKKANSIANNSEVGFYSQMDFSLYSISAFDFLKNMCNVMGIDKHQANSRIEYWLKKFDLWTAKDKSLNAFSWGMKNRMNLILCFIKEPQILILDEPGANLDSKWRNHTYDILNQFKQDSECTIILTVHNIDEIYDVIQNFVILEKGKLLFNGTKEELNLYKKIRVSFDSKVDLNFVEKTLNEHDILTFDFNDRSNSIIVGLRPNQNFNDVLATLEVRGVKTKDIVGQPINIDEIQKALKDKITPHQPKFLPVSASQTGGVQSNLTVSKPEIEKEKLQEYERTKDLDFDYDEVMNSYDKTRIMPLDETIQNDNNTLQDTEGTFEKIDDSFEFGNDEIKDALLFLEQIERKYESMIDLDHNIPTLMVNPNSVGELANLEINEPFKVEQAEKAKEIEAISLRLVEEKENIDEIRVEIKHKIDDLKALQSEVAVATYQESQNLLALKEDFTGRLVELRAYVEQLRAEDEIIEATKAQLNLQIQELLDLKADITNLINDEKDLIQSDIKELKQYISQVHFETEIMADAKENLEQKADELKEFLAKTDFENQSLSAKQLELQAKFDEIKNLQTEMAFKSFAEHQSLEEFKQVFEAKIGELKTLVDQVNEQEQHVDDAKKDLTSKLSDLNALKEEIEITIREEHAALSFDITDLKDQLTQIKDEADVLQESKDFITEQAETVKKTQAELLEMLREQQVAASNAQIDNIDVSELSFAIKAELEDEKLQAQGKIDELKQFLAQAKDELSALQAQQTITAQENFAEKAELGKIQEEQLSELSFALKAEIADEKLQTQSEIEQLKQFLAQTKNELNALQAQQATIVQESLVEKQQLQNVQTQQSNADMAARKETTEMIYNPKPIFQQHQAGQSCNNENQPQAASVNNAEIEALKQNLYKEYSYFEKMRHDAIIEKEMNEKLANFDKELKMREEKLELERLKREIQEEKAKLSEFIMLQKANN